MNDSPESATHVACRNAARQIERRVSKLETSQNGHDGLERIKIQIFPMLLDTGGYPLFTTSEGFPAYPESYTHIGRTWKLEPLDRARQISRYLEAYLRRIMFEKDPDANCKPKSWVGSISFQTSLQAWLCVRLQSRANHTSNAWL
ncbi:hypothetical protein BDV29DRAFT_123720 [Aspergillus leporis]|uniref:Uncharacterized protein n=1 Tax=Aspergillus leporis TaxID=41062 RepID=A0A5N5X0R2_9EURO|nr:hypothetical protein BDV29DRAFT_123720 [Aspergillus leporis]